MIEYNIKKLKKQIIYRCSYTGTKETDLLYQKLIVNKIDTLSNKELYQLSILFNVTDITKKNQFEEINNAAKFK